MVITNEVGKFKAGMLVRFRLLNKLAGIELIIVVSEQDCNMFCKTEVELEAKILK